MSLDAAPKSACATVRTLLAGSLDYAGLFPPAALDMATAVRNYAGYRKGDYAWILGRFVVPGGRKGEVDPAWPLAVLETVPGRIEVCGQITYCEIPSAANEIRAKIRMGGDTIPEPAAVARFLRACAAARVAFKATAGLHHPLRKPPAHGFVNLFLAAALAWRGEDPLATLEESSAAAFYFGEEAVEWHGHRVSVRELSEVREQFAISFGSCSFEEPILDLRALGWL
jgi:hypothetical protein